MPSDYDHKLARVVLRSGFATEAELQDCGRRLERRRESGEDVDLADILLRRRLISEAQLEAIDRGLIERGADVPDAHAEVMRRREAEAAGLDAVELGEIPDEAFEGGVACKSCGALIVEQSVADGQTDARCPRCRAERPEFGQVFRGCRIGEVLGEGRTGPAWKARDLTRRRDVVVKTYPERLARSAASLDAFLKAAERTARLARPRLVNVLDVARWGRGGFVVTDCVEGPTLRNAVDEAAGLPVAWRLARLAPLLEEAVEAVAALHDVGLTHGELHPRKFLVDAEGAVRLADGGIPLSRYFEVDPPADAYPSDLGDAADAIDGDLLALGRILAEVVLGGRRPEATPDLTRDLHRRTRSFIEQSLASGPGRRIPTIPQLRRETARLRKLYAR